MPAQRPRRHRLEPREVLAHRRLREEAPGRTALALSPILTTVLPVFGLIALGYVFAKLKWVGDGTAKGLTQFVFVLAIPALLFKTVVSMPVQEAAPWGLWIAMFGGLAITWIVTAFAARNIESLSASGGAAASMAAGFGNVALLGTPLVLAHYGQPAAVALGMVLSVHAPILWLAATLHRELAIHAKQISWAAIGRELILNLAGNAIVLALAAAGLWRLTGLGLHPVPERMLSMLADASIPTALFSLGLSLASYNLSGQWGGTAALIALKMVLAPVAVFLLLHAVPPMPPLWSKVAILLAAMPTGANAFLFSHRYNESAAAVSAAIAIGTALAAVSASVLLYLMD